MPTALRLVAAAALCVGTAAGAQDYDAGRAGATATLSLGASSAGVNCTPRCGGDRNSGPTYSFRGMEALNPQFSLGVEADVFQQRVQTVSGPGNWRMTWLMISAQWYPQEDGDVFAKVGFGSALVRANVTFPSVGALDLSTTNVGFTVGIGRDIRLTEHLGVTLTADYLTTPRSVAFLNGAEQNARVGADVLKIGLGVSVF